MSTVRIGSVGASLIMLADPEGRKPGEVTSYKLSPEELVIERDRLNLKAHIASKKPMPTFGEVHIKEQEAAQMAAIPFTREEYLQMRLSGLTRNQVCKDHNTSPGTLYNFLDKWGIKDRNAERAELDKLREGQPTEPAEAKEVAEPITEEIAVSTPIDQPSIDKVANVITDQILGTVKNPENWNVVAPGTPEFEKAVTEMFQGTNEAAAIVDEVETQRKPCYWPPLPNSYELLGQEAGRLVDTKQRAYGNSVERTEKIMHLFLLDYYDRDNNEYTIPAELLSHLLVQVRMMDKQMRVFTNPAGDLMGESPYDDIVGYSLIAAKRARNQRGNQDAQEKQATP